MAIHNSMHFSRFFPLAALIISLGSFSSCGYYHGNEGVLASSCQTISIDLLADDWNGDLTAALVECLAASSTIQYRTYGGDMILQVKLEDLDEKNIGFRYDRHKDGKILKSIVPSETRLTALAKVTLLEAATNTSILGPIMIKASIDFDHDYYNTRNGVNIFSLGQLNDYDEAYDAAYRPLMIALAEKIVDYLAEAW
jgi:hypothetical protein